MISYDLNILEQEYGPVTELSLYVPPVHGTISRSQLDILPL